ncbi:MAG: aminotransferase class I/II-fold pyridoxal phosphate-dependent enzyme [Bacillota bacterium]
MGSQNSAPIAEALLAYRNEGALRLHMPGHKGRPLLPPDLAVLDATEVPGLDDLHDASGPIAEAQRLCADLYGARESFFLVGGSTAGIVALVLASSEPGRPVVVPRHAHRSLLSGLVLSGARPIWVEPLYDPQADLVLGVPADRYRQALAFEPGATAVWAVSPTYQGVAADLEAVSAMAEARGLPLLVDEAHGAHFPFDRRLPRAALTQGAAAVVQSAHKSLTALTQAAWLHVGTERLDRERLRGALRLVQTSSPSYVLMASLDLARRHLAREGRKNLAAAVDASLALRSSLCGDAALPQPAMPAPVDGLVVQVDPTKLWLDVSALGLTGPEADRLLRRLGVQVEMAGPRHVLVILTLADGDAEAHRFIAALAELAQTARAGLAEDAPRRAAAPAPAHSGGPGLWLPGQSAIRPPAEMTPREALFRPHQAVSLESSAGRVAAESLVPYPPGIPLVMPGERLTPDLISWVREALAAGVRFQGAADPSLQSISVVA